ncbi:MAG: DUF1549 domain-containing protein [Saprospiraceae bacterium]|nr:DUF1549 domain-containing protein [Saprospiraceae bacterium]
MRLLLILSGILSIIILFTECGTRSESIDPRYAKQLFVHEIYPVLQRKCLSCHGEDPDKIEGDFQLLSRSSLLRGGQSGKAAVVPGEPEESLLIHLIEGRDPESTMPPKRDEQLTGDEIQWFRDWVSAGAIWPDKAEQAEILAAGEWQFGDRIQVQTSGGQEKSWDDRRYKRAQLWAFYPLTDPIVPKSKYEHPIDAFLQSGLQEVGLGMAKKASKLTLLRRATFNLTGLPPTPEEVEAFLNDESDSAYANLIDRLLASPHYGEQWGKHWLDVVRYADSDGYSNDFVRPNAWRYRDYVIRSFNEDKPYHQFIKEQLAGDEINSEHAEMLIATGFLRMGPWEHTGMAIAAETRQLFLDDVTNIVGETFLSLPLGCAKCHDHKYDPIPTKDYYQVQAVFAPTQFANRSAAFLAVENQEGMAEEQERIAYWINKTKAEEKAIKEKEEDAARQWFTARGLAYLDKRTRRKLPDDQQPPRYYGLTFEDLGYRKVLQKRRQTLNKTKLRFEPYAYSVYNGPNRVVHSGRSNFLPQEIGQETPATFVLNGGSIYAPLEEVPAGVLSAVQAMAQPLDGAMLNETPNPIPQTRDGRRLAFANWLIEGENPLVIRSIVNRIWQQHFGKGIVETSNNFGGTGKAPTHPELLDWLCQAFIQEGWSIKALNRLIMTSEAYQQSSQAKNTDKTNRVDPENKLLSHYPPRRLGAEEIRDATLLASGELNPTLGGIPIRPEMNQEIALQPRHTMGSIAMAYQPSTTKAARNRRTIYAEKIRNLPDPFLQVFNQPSTEISCERRSSSTVAPQAFTLMNSRQLRDRAIALALRLEEQAEADLESRVHLAGRLCWNRQLDERELAQATAYVRSMEEYHRSNAAQAVTYPTSITRKMFEEMTGEPFEYEEELDVFHAYQADAKDADVPPSTRALADLAMVLFNTNEFLYVF